MGVGSQNGHQELYISSQPLRGNTLHCFSETETIPIKNIHATMFYKNLGFYLDGV